MQISPLNRIFIAAGILVFSTVIPSFADNDFHGLEKRTSKYPAGESPPINNSFPVFTVDTAQNKCMDTCLRQHQQVAMGFAALEEICRKDCAVSKALHLSTSTDKKERLAGIEALCMSDDNRAVAPLIKALKRDLSDRTGIWAMIIPALGISGDFQAIPILTQTLTMMDDDWLGREMSAEALGRIGAPASIPALLAAAWRADTRDTAIIALAKFQDKRVVPALISALDPEEEQQTRDAAISGLQRLDPIAVPQMIEAFLSFAGEHPETPKRLWLCQILANSQDTRSIKVIRDRINDPDQAVRACVRKSLNHQ